MANAVTEIQRFRINRNAWKSNLLKEILELEDNLDQIFQLAGVKPHRVVSNESSEIDESTIVTNNKKQRYGASSGKSGQPDVVEAIIDEHFDEIHKATHNICALITSVTEFDLPIPVHVLLKLASRLHSLKWPDYKKKLTGSISKEYIYKKSPSLVQASLKLFKWISAVLGTNALPFQPYINRDIMKILDWTRISDFRHHDQIGFLEIRSQCLDNISSIIESLSTNLNLEPAHLTTLIDVEITQILEEILLCNHSTQQSNPSDRALAYGSSRTNSQQLHLASRSTSKDDPRVSRELKEDYVLTALYCLERLFIVYADFLDALQEHRIKSFVIQTCLKMYRDFERNVIGLAIRRQLIKMVETLANRPYASSTTELAWHIFELAERFEIDAEIKFIARRANKVGLAHRPTIVSSYGVYTSYVSTTLNVPEKELALEQEERVQLEDALERSGEQLEQSGLNVRGESPGDSCKEMAEEMAEKSLDEKPEDDPLVQSCLSLFVDKPAS